MEADFQHVPVMAEQVMELLQPESGGVYWDLTLGTGGHLEQYLRRAPEGTRCFGLDGDPAALPRARARLARAGLGQDHVTLAHGDLGTLDGCADWPAPMAVLLDVGLSSPQVDDPTRGFSYRHDGPLDMRMDPTRGLPASLWLEEIGQKDLEHTIRELGEERFAGRIARVIKEALPLDSTVELAEIITRVIPRKDPRHHPARRTFQALRIAVNQELERFESGLNAVCDRLAPGGRVVVLSYHSGEDRVAKNVFRARKRTDLELLTKKPVGCSKEEARDNPRARSVKLRAAQKRPAST